MIREDGTEEGVEGSHESRNESWMPGWPNLIHGNHGMFTRKNIWFNMFN